MRPKNRISILSLIFITFLLVIFVLPSAEAICPEIIISRESFFPGETVQVEINGDFTRDLLTTDISIVRQSDNVKLPLEIFLTKISDSKFFAFFDLPTSNPSYAETYVVKVAARCSTGYIVRSKQFTIKKPIAQYYYELKNLVGTNWQYLNTEEHASILAAYSHDPEFYQQAKTAFSSRGCPTSCSIIENSLAAIATKEQIYVQWLQNNVDGACWGSPCNSRKTAYALLALKLTNKTINESSISWLENNAQEDEEKAILSYIKENNQDYSYLVSRQSVYGYWLKGSTPDRVTTALAVFALKNILNDMNDSQDRLILENSIENAEEWLLSNFNSGTKKEKALSLFFVFPKENIESIMSVWPGVVKIESPASFSLILQNKGMNRISAIVSALNKSSVSTLEQGEIKNIQFTVPLITTPGAAVLFENIEIYYENNYGYNTLFDVPLIIFTQAGETSGIVIITNETNVTSTQANEIKNETYSNQTNKTTQENVSLIGNPLKFDETEIIREIDYGKSFTVVLRLSNELDQELKNIYIGKSSILSLMGGVSIEPDFISKMPAGSSKDITVTVAPQKTGHYEGTIYSSVRIDDTLYKESVTLSVNVKSTTPAINITGSENKTCAQLGGKECGEDESCAIVPVVAKDTFICCIPPSNCKKQEEESQVPILGIIIFGIVIAAIIVVLIIISKKKKKQMSEILEETKQKYERNFQRRMPR